MRVFIVQVIYVMVGVLLVIGAVEGVLVRSGRGDIRFVGFCLRRLKAPGLEQSRLTGPRRRKARVASLLCLQGAIVASFDL